ncbi:MAG: hypothetical protein ACTSXH_17330 [Promethearchaeota archaeon]
MYKIEKLDDNMLYIKAIGTFPPSVTDDFIENFEKLTMNIDTFSVIVDLLDAILLHVKSFDKILNLLKKNNEKLMKSVFVISNNPLLKKEFILLIEEANTPKRKIVNNFKEAKEWIGIKEIRIKSD